MKILWRWSPKQDAWVYELPAKDDERSLEIALRGARRRAPKHTLFRWTASVQEPPLKKYRQRASKVKEGTES